MVYWAWASPSTGMTAPLTPSVASPARWVSDETTLVSAAAPYVAPIRFSLTRISVFRLLGRDVMLGTVPAVPPVNVRGEQLMPGGACVVTRSVYGSGLDAPL